MSHSLQNQNNQGGNVTNGSTNNNNNFTNKRRRTTTGTAITKAQNLSSSAEVVLFHCSYCQKDISSVVRIKCATCLGVDLCVECFSVGAEPFPHHARHAYHVIDDLSFPLLTLDWGADEELLLLEGVEIFGLSNWTDVSEHVGTKSKSQCQQHYVEQYVKSPCAPLPDMKKVLGKGHKKLTEEDQVELKKKQKQKSKLKEENETGGREEAENKENAEVEISLLQQLSKPGEIRAEGNISEMTGYNVKRNEFDPEYDIEAELPLAEMEFRELDTEEDRLLKIRMIEIYNERLSERQRRKNFILERGLLNVKKQQMFEKKRTQYERDLHGSLRVFMRYLSQSEYDVLLEGLAAENRIRMRIAELKEYRRNGITTLQEGDNYDVEKQRRMEEFSRLKSFESPHSRRKALPLAQTQPRVDANNKSSVFPSPVGRSLKSSNLNLNAISKKKMYIPLDLATLPGVELLSKVEKELCITNRMLPVQFLMVKVNLMKLSQERGKSDPLKRAEVRQMFKIEPIKSLRIYDLLCQCGYVISGEEKRAEEEEEEGEQNEDDEEDDDEEGEEEEEEEDEDASVEEEEEDDDEE
jgi:transcriptional adapter 2-alpha